VRTISADCANAGGPNVTDNVCQKTNAGTFAGTPGPGDRGATKRDAIDSVQVRNGCGCARAVAEASADAQNAAAAHADRRPARAREGTASPCLRRRPSNAARLIAVAPIEQE